ncbi:MAG: hypothetical protein Q9227_005765 [Pyrenula ochraceoflavens]
MTSGPLRPVLHPRSSAHLCSSCAARHALQPPSSAALKLSKRAIATTPKRSLAQVQDDRFSNAWFSPAAPNASKAHGPIQVRNTAGTPPEVLHRQNDSEDKKPPDERIIKLGKTLRTLTSHLPNLLTSPQSIPQDILSPSISLHLFPSTHPHLPTVRGRVAYRAALLTAPVAWGSVPLVGGGCKLEIVSERMSRTGYGDPLDTDGQGIGAGEEKLIVRWKTKKANNNDQNQHQHQHPSTSPTPSTSTASLVSPTSPTETPINTSNPSNSPRLLTTLFNGRPTPLFPLHGNNPSFTGLFIFLFDSEGRVRSHTIEHADEAGTSDKVGRVVTVADWLLARVRGRQGEEGKWVPGLASVGAWEGEGCAAAAAVERARRRR